jgi:hypothetical protein
MPSNLSTLRLKRSQTAENEDLHVEQLFATEAAAVVEA